MGKEYKLIEISAYAVGQYSGAEYFERAFITPEDYIKYFGSGQSTDAVTFEEYIENTWCEKEITIYDLDGKYSESTCDIEVDFWTEEDLESWEEIENSGDKLANEIAETALNKPTFEEREKFIREIREHAEELIKSIDSKVTIKCKIPKSRVTELKSIVDNLNNQQSEESEDNKVMLAFIANLHGDNELTTYNEIVLMTFSDYIKYFGNGQCIVFESDMKKLWYSQQLEVEVNTFYNIKQKITGHIELKSLTLSELKSLVKKNMINNGEEMFKFIASKASKPDAYDEETWNHKFREHIAKSVKDTLINLKYTGAIV